MSRLPLSFALALAGLLAVGAAPGQAYHLGGKKWPTRTITYHSSAKQYRSAIGDAVRLWNTSGAKVRFKAVKRSRAKLKIVYGGAGGPSGRATLGWTPVLTYRTLGGAPISGAENIPCGTKLGGDRLRCERRGPMVWLDRVSKTQLKDPFIRRYMVLTVAHELGHSLGLQHNHPACSVMSYRRDTTCPQPPVPWEHRCRLIERDDLKGILRRYGGKAKPLAPEFCQSYTPPPAPTGLAAAYDPAEELIGVSWTNGPAPYVAVALSKGKCTPYDINTPYTAAASGAPQGRYEYPDGPGRYCVSAWALDKDLQVGPAVSAWVDVPA